MSDTPTKPERPAVRRAITVLDTPDPSGLADFYSRLTGWPVLQSDDDWVTIRSEDGLLLAFQLAPDHVPPTWPANDVPQQFHLDLYVDDLDAGRTYAEFLGARHVEPSQDREDFRVFTDPSGHPFCLCLMT